MAYSSAVVSQVDYDSEIQPIFTANCIQCHGGTSGVTLSSYDNAMNSVGQQYGTMVIIAGEPNQSPIIDKISNSNPAYGLRMPRNGPPYLSDSEINLIRTWIAEGANEIPVSNETKEQLPIGFKLNGSYPNPFNPTTTISFEVPQAVSYQIKIYALNGTLIEEVAGSALPGNISVRMNFRNLSSGIYFYKVLANTGQQKYLIGSDKVILIK